MQRGGYATFQLAQLLQTVACNGAHSIEQRAAKWIIMAQEPIPPPLVPLTDLGAPAQTCRIPIAAG